MRSGRPPAQPPPYPMQLVGVRGREQEGRESWGKDKDVVVPKEKLTMQQSTGDFIFFQGFIRQNNGE